MLVVPTGVPIKPGSGNLRQFKTWLPVGQIAARDITCDPFWITFGCHHDVENGNWITTGLYPSFAVAATAYRSPAAKTGQIDLAVPLPMPHADGTLRVEAAISGLERDDVERMGAVRAGTINNVTGVRHKTSSTCRISIGSDMAAAERPVAPV
jgi:hypothetical protein